MIVLWDSYGIPIGFPLCFYDISMGVLKEFYGILKDFFVVLMLFPCYLFNLSSKIWWDSHWVSMIFRWGYSGISNESKLKAI